MPFKARRPAGGFRVMYEYANRLAQLGYKVHITYPLKTKFMEYRWSYPIRWLLSRIEGFSADEWFPFRKEITRSYIKEVSDKYIDEADVIITTWWSTAMDVGKLSDSKGKKINLIQGYEDWEGHVDLLHATYDMPRVTNVVVASYLKEIVNKYTNKPVYFISNAIDNRKFKVKDSIEDRNLATVCMVYSTQEIKGSQYGIEALRIVKKKYPQLKVDLFGVCPEPDDLPSWMAYFRNPSDLSDLYNRNAIFITNSLTEGFGLVSVEAMACGCALICTDILGHREYAVDGETALLVPVKDPDKMAERIINLIEDNDYRKELAQRGNAYIQGFSWDRAVVKMNDLIKQVLDT